MVSSMSYMQCQKMRHFESLSADHAQKFVPIYRNDGDAFGFDQVYIAIVMRGIYSIEFMTMRICPMQQRMKCIYLVCCRMKPLAEASFELHHEECERDRVSADARNVPWGPS